MHTNKYEIDKEGKKYLIFIFVIILPCPLKNPFVVRRSFSATFTFGSGMHYNLFISAQPLLNLSKFDAIFTPETGNPYKNLTRHVLGTFIGRHWAAREEFSNEYMGEKGYNIDFKGSDLILEIEKKLNEFKGDTVRETSNSM